MRLPKSQVSTLLLQTIASDQLDAELDSLVSQYKEAFPNFGRRMLRGALIADGYAIQWHRIMLSLRRVDPVGTLARQIRQSVTRYEYWVPRPNYLWHFDGHHKLIRWRFIIHGCIDGFSRRISYLFAATNNKAETVLHAFMKGCELMGLPEKVRCDKGRENTGVAAFMFRAHRASDNNSNIVLAGRSVHNQRIERLWRDVNRVVCSRFRELFLSMESDSILNPDSYVDVLVLQKIFLPRLREALDVFVQIWDYHPMASEGNKSPLRLWNDGWQAAGSQPNWFDVAESIDWNGEIPMDLDNMDESIELGEIEMPSIISLIEQKYSDLNLGSSIVDDASAVECYITLSQAISHVSEQ